MIKSIHRRYRGDIINYNRAPRSSQLYLVWTYNHVLTKVVSLTKNCEKGKKELKKHIVQYFTERCGNNNNLAPSPNPLGIKMSFFKTCLLQLVILLWFSIDWTTQGITQNSSQLPFYCVWFEFFLCLLGGERRIYRLFSVSLVSPLSINYNMY